MPTRPTTGKTPNGPGSQQRATGLRMEIPGLHKRDRLDAVRRRWERLHVRSGSASGYHLHLKSRPTSLMLRSEACVWRKGKNNDK